MNDDSNKYIKIFTKYSQYTTDLKNMHNEVFINAIQQLYNNIIKGYQWTYDTYKVKDVSVIPFHSQPKEIWRAARGMIRAVTAHAAAATHI